MNVVVVYADDLRADTLGGPLRTALAVDPTPHVTQYLLVGGTRFSQAFATAQECSPVRASLLTGLSARPSANGGHGITVNASAASNFVAAGHHLATLGVSAQAAGFATAFVGKTLNHFNALPAGTVWPGWSFWSVLKDPEYMGAVWNVNGVESAAPSGENSTERCRVDIGTWLRAQTGPFFAVVAPYGVHSPVVITGTQEAGSGLYAGFEWRPPAHNVTRSASGDPDAPWYIPASPQPNVDAENVRRLRMTRAVDRVVGEVIAALTDLGALDETLVIFTADQGLHWREMAFSDKCTPYAESIRFPLAMCGPGVPAGATRPHLVTSDDLAPTILDALGLPFGDCAGDSLLAIAADPGAAWRSDALIQNWDRRRYDGVVSIDANGIAGGRTFVRYKSPSPSFTQLLDHADEAAVPYNRAPARPAEVAALDARLAVLLA